MTGEVEIVFYTRKGCHLCDEALLALERLPLAGAEPFSIRVVDLDLEAPPDKRAAYDHEVPVLELAGKKVMKYRVDPERLLRLLRAAASGEPGPARP